MGLDPKAPGIGAGATAGAQWAFARYEAIRERLPTAVFPACSRRADNLEALAGEFDVFILDALGVLNVGDTAVPGAPERVAALSDHGKALFVLTNGATYDEGVALEKYRRLGFAFEPRQIVSSRSLLHGALNKFPGGFRWGVGEDQRSAPCRPIYSLRCQKRFPNFAGIFLLFPAPFPTAVVIGI